MGHPKDGDIMYIRKWIPHTDRIKLIDLASTTFHVKRSKVNKILNSAYDVLVFVTDDGEITGFLCYRLYFQRAAFVDYLMFDGKYRGQGISYTLFPLVLNALKRNGIRGIYGFVSKSNQKALSIFKEWGCIPIHTFPNHFLVQMLI